MENILRGENLGFKESNHEIEMEIDWKKGLGFEEMSRVRNRTTMWEKERERERGADQKRRIKSGI